MRAPPPRPQGLAAPRGWLALWLVTLVFLAQLFTSTQHDHELSAKSQHCVACALHVQPHAAPPPALPAPAPAVWHLLRTLAPLAPPASAAPAADYLLPPAHAPPASLLS